jgi:hypothetical protein
MKLSDNKPYIDLVQLEQEIGNQLRNRFSDAKTIPQEHLIPTIHELIIQAYLYRFETEQHFTQYVITAWQFGQEFNQEFAGVKETLSSSHLDAEEKSKWLTQWSEDMTSYIQRG